MKYCCGFEFIIVSILLQQWPSYNNVATADLSKATETNSKRLRGRPAINAQKVYDIIEANDPSLNTKYERLIDPSLERQHQQEQQEQTLKLRGRNNADSAQNRKHVGVTLDVVALQKKQNNNNTVGTNNEASNKNRNHPPNTELIDSQELTSEEAMHQPRRHDKSLHILPMGDDKYNHTLYEELHNAPFEIYESSFAEGKEEKESSFPVFIVPDWKKYTTGVYSGFSRTATPLAFQNIQFLLTWNDIVDSSSGTDAPLVEFMNECEFEASLFIGKILGGGSHVPFLGLLISYKQNSMKNILIPFAKLENFFHETSEKYLLSETTKHLEHDLLHDMLDEERSNNTTNSLFHHKILHGTNRKEQLEDIEAIHFRRLFQLLVRRTFLFSFGYADCLKVEPHNLRECLDDTFRLVVQMEASVRDALDNLLLEELASATQINSLRAGEACIALSSSSSWYGATEDCLSFEGLAGSASLSTLSSSTFNILPITN